MTNIEGDGFDARLRQAGARVRLRFDPGRIGACTGEAEDGPDGLEVRVTFHGQRPEWVAASELELLAAEPADPVSMLMQGQVGRSRDLRRELARVQLNGRLSEMFYSMDTTNTDFHPHQFKPVLAMLDSPSQGLLIADEVGLGKTIEAGLIWTELRFRKQARRLLVVCPAMLTEKWRQELRNRFGTVGVVTDAAGLLEAINQAESESRESQCLICSLQGIRPPREWDDETRPSMSPSARLARRLAEATPEHLLFDLTVIDEAHYLRNPETASAALGRLLRDASSHLALLTATPVNTKSADLFSLLNLVDPEQFRFEHEFSTILAANRPLVQASGALRRLGTTAGEVLPHLVDARRSRVLASSEQLGLLIDDLEKRDSAEVLSHEDRVNLSMRVERTNLLGQAVTRTRKREVLENRVVRNARHTSVGMSNVEKDFYNRVTEAVRDYAAGQMAGVEGFLLAMPQRQMASSMYAAAKRWKDAYSCAGDDELIWETLDEEHPGQGGLEGSPVVAHICQYLRDVDLKALRAGDSKYNELQKTVRQFLKDHPEQKLIVFSYFRDTLAYLHERFEEIGIGSVVVQGGDDKNKIIDDFQQSPIARVLLSSEVAAEGVDLQFMRLLINYDLPWNPMKVEQRIGRIDRLGQMSPSITILSLVYADTVDDRILTRLFDRLNLFESALGSMEDVLGTEIAEMTRDLLSGRLTPEQESERIEQTRAAIEQLRNNLALIEEHESDLLGLGDFVRERIIDARNGNRRVSDIDLLHYIQGFLNDHAHGHVLRGDSQSPVRFGMQLPPSIAAALDRFIQSRRLRRTALCSADEIRVRIENQVSAKLLAREELINQFHPLIAFINEEYKSSANDLPLVSVKLPHCLVAEKIQPGAYAFVAESWSFAGARDEDLIRAAFVRADGQVLLEGQGAVDVLGELRLHSEDWVHYLGAIAGETQVADCLESAKRLLSRRFSAEGKTREAENNDRVRIQKESIQRNFSRRAEKIRQRIQQAQILKQRTVKADQGRLRALERETELLMARIDHAASFQRSRTGVCAGIVEFTP